jgi:hypothetical protein
MIKSKRWRIIRGRVLMLLGIASLLIAMFNSGEIPTELTPIVVVFGVGFIALAIPFRVWKNMPSWFNRDDTWL